jgi:hypothetical protein
MHAENALRHARLTRGVQFAASGHLRLHKKVGPAVYHSTGAPHGTAGKDKT